MLTQEEIDRAITLKIWHIEQAPALQLGYVPLTIEIHPDTERWMLINFITDMLRGRVDFALVALSRGIEVWRKPAEMICEETA
ncbi:MAG: hypothetical protein QM796_18710 [Chthoniobacteraceae bacterium]